MSVRITITQNNIPALLARLPEVQQQLADESAAALANRVRRQIDANGQVNSGAMESSVYTVSPSGSTYDRAAAQARDANPDVDLLPQLPAPRRGEAAVGVAVSYAEHQHDGWVTAGGGVVPGRPFLDQAVEAERQDFLARCRRLEELLS